MTFLPFNRPADEIKEIRDNVALELECFVHGSMCISYSGRCYMSSFINNRSGNRGECTNTCRWDYTLMENSRPGTYYPVYENDRGTYVMSSRDLCMIAHLDALADAGITSFKIEGRMKGISCAEVMQKLKNNESPFILDVRGPDEFEQVRLGIGETLIPLGALRKRLREIPQDKEKEIICYCKISLRGYEAELVLEGNGWKNVKVMEGGVMAWPYPREK